MIVYFIRSLTAYKGWFFFLVIISALGGLFGTCLSSGGSGPS